MDEHFCQKGGSSELLNKSIRGEVDSTACRYIGVWMGSEETLVCGPYRIVPSIWAEGYWICGESGCAKGRVRQSC
ncbi:hypothetical protein R6Q59_022204 [Mikania micrantha]